MSDKNKTLNSASKKIMENLYMNALSESFEEYFPKDDVVDFLISKTKDSVSELIELDTILTKISKTGNLTAKQLEEIGNASFETASKYGGKASDYLLSVQQMSYSGYPNTKELAEVSMLAQSSSDLDADLANEYLFASDAAYKYAGNVEKLTALLDLQNQVANRNLIDMEKLAAATIAASDQMAAANINENEMTALLGTGIAATGEDGEAVGNAVKSIIMTLQQVQGESGFEGDIIDKNALKKAETRCHSLGVELKYMQDGIVKLKDPIEILKELSRVYNALPDHSTQKAGILSDIGRGYSSDVLSGILSNWEQYEKMLGDSENADGSSMKNAMQTADSWEGSLNRLSNTWSDTVGNIANSDFSTFLINGLNDILNVANQMTDTLGPVLSIGLGAGFMDALKNVGSPKMSGPNCCFEYADSSICSYGYISFLTA